jgi:hypothetical protein
MWPCANLGVDDLLEDMLERYAEEAVTTRFNQQEQRTRLDGAIFYPLLVER